MKLNKLFKWGMVGLIVISIVILVWGFVSGWPTEGEPATAPVNTLLGWTYVMIGLAVFCWVVLGLILSVKNNPKSLAKIGLALAVAVVLCLISYLLAPGSDPMAYTGEPVDKVTLKLTDAILTLTYIVGAASIVAIIVGEVKMSMTNKKK